MTIHTSTLLAMCFLATDLEVAIKTGKGKEY
jgi:hypothetical protein